MADSQTSREQKAVEFAEIQHWVRFLQDNGLETIKLSDLKAACRALETVNPDTKE